MNIIIIQIRPKNQLNFNQQVLSNQPLKRNFGKPKTILKHSSFKYYKGMGSIIKKISTNRLPGQLVSIFTQDTRLNLSLTFMPKK